MLLDLVALRLASGVEALGERLMRRFPSEVDAITRFLKQIESIEQAMAIFMEKHDGLWWLAHIAKNALGVLLILAGIAMLVLPGQGVLSILIGVMLLDIPGKYRFERWLVMRPPVWRAIAWLREKARRDALILDRRDRDSK